MSEKIARDVVITFIEASQDPHGFSQVLAHFIARTDQGEEAAGSSERMALCNLRESICKALNSREKRETWLFGSDILFNILARVNYSTEMLQEIATAEKKKKEKEEESNRREQQRVDAKRVIQEKLGETSRGHYSIDYDCNHIRVESLNSYNRFSRQNENVFSSKTFRRLKSGGFNWPAIEEAIQVRRSLATKIEKELAEQCVRDKESAILKDQLYKEYDLSKINGIMSVDDWGHLVLKIRIKSIDSGRGILSFLSSQPK